MNIQLTSDCVSIAAPDIQAACMSLLALLCHGVCDKWRASVLSTTLKSPNEAVRVTAVRAFPLLLHHLGNSHHNLISSALLYGHLYCTSTLLDDHFWVSFLFNVSQFQGGGQFGAGEKGACQGRRAAELSSVRKLSPQ